MVNVSCVPSSWEHHCRHRVLHLAGILWLTLIMIWSAVYLESDFINRVHNTALPFACIWPDFLLLGTFILMGIKENRGRLRVCSHIPSQITYVCPQVWTITAQNLVAMPLSFMNFVYTYTIDERRTSHTAGLRVRSCLEDLFPDFWWLLVWESESSLQRYISVNHLLAEAIQLEYGIDPTNPAKA